MTKESLAIISSYNELCGNASYTKALERELSQYFNVTVIPLNVDLLRKGSSKHSKLHIKEICLQLKKFDCVNIQFEAGLFGSRLFAIKKNFFLIANASKKLVITMHRYQAFDKYPGLIAFFKNLFLGRIKNYILACKKVYANNRYVPFYNRVISYCKSKKIPIVIHTKRDKDLIDLEFNGDNVYNHPLSFYRQDYIASLRASYDRKAFCQDLGLNPLKTYIGIFGFINQYKGHETAIQALQYLPDQYELLICGSQHPHTIQIESPIDPYINGLLEMIRALKLAHRVKFYRLARDEDFLKALISCDFNVLPYLEVKQGGSAIAALSLETNSRTILSQNFAFFELEKYAPDCFKMFTIGNYLELANAIETYNPKKYADNLKEYHEKYNIQTSGLLYRDLLRRDLAHLSSYSTIVKPSDEETGYCNAL